MSLPELRVEQVDGVVVVVGSGRRRGILRRRLKRWRATLHCLAHGHEWSPWHCDDVDGPVELVSVLDDAGDEHVDAMPLLSRVAGPDEFGWRTCRNRCGAAETRYPLEQAPPLWQDAIARAEAAGFPIGLGWP